MATQERQPKKNEENKDIVKSIGGTYDGGAVSIDYVSKYKEGPWWRRIFSSHEPKENYQRHIWHNFTGPNDTTIITPVGTARSVYVGPKRGQVRTPNFDYINGLFTTTFDNAGYEWVWGSKPKPRQKNGGTLISNKPTLISKYK